MVFWNQLALAQDDGWLETEECCELAIEQDSLELTKYLYHHIGEQYK